MLHDGSGLNRGQRLPPAVLAALLALAAAPDHPELRPVLTGLPVAGFTGTLSTRYPRRSARRPPPDSYGPRPAPSTGVNTLAGTVVDRDGRLLAFAFMARHTAPRAEAQTPWTVRHGGGLC